MVQLQSLCGVVVCERLCVRSEHCGAGLARRRVLLGHLRMRRQFRRRQCGETLEFILNRKVSDIIKAELNRRAS